MKNLFCLIPVLSVHLLAGQPVALNDQLSIRKVTSVENNCVRIDHHPVTGALYYATISGSVYEVDPESGDKQEVYNSTDHGLTAVFGFEIGASGHFYLVQAGQSASTNTAIIKKGIPSEAATEWTTMATASYARSSLRDHQFSAIIESPDGQYVYVNSGSRTDHGEESSDGTREFPITSAILKIPVTAENLELQNDEDFLKDNGYLLADGTRNTFDLEYAPNGDLFGAENSGTRDDEEELNWIREGHHYGFPWRLGSYANPQQFPDYDPPASDPLLVEGINMESTFYNDPSFPAAPAEVSFTAPVTNHGPDADSFRDPADGMIRDGSEAGKALGTFTPHSSPLALTFDVDSTLGGGFRGKGFVMSYNNAALKKYAPFDEPGQDLLMLELVREEDAYQTHTYRIAQGFNGPVDATLIANKMYIIENGDGASIWEVTFPEAGEVVTGINALPEGLESFSVYPNAFDEAVNIHIRFDHRGSGSAAIYAQEGKRIGRVWAGEYGSRQPLNLLWNGKNPQGSEVLPGVYLLVVEFEKGTYRHRLIKE